MRNTSVDDDEEMHYGALKTIIIEHVLDTGYDLSGGKNR